MNWKIPYENRWKDTNYRGKIVTSTTMQLLFVLISVFAISSLYIFMRMSLVQPKPYMDEIFHIPQAREYCAGNFTSVSLALPPLA